MTMIKSWREVDLETDDLKRFELVFARTVRDYLPCTEVHFLALEPAAQKDATAGDDVKVPSSWEVGAAMVAKSRQPVVDRERRRLYLPLWKKESLFGIAIAGAEEQTLFETSVNWLLDRSRLISDAFLHTKRWAVDPLSGLLNGRFFLEEIDVLLQEKRRVLAAGESCAAMQTSEPDAMHSPFLSVALVEIYPLRARKTGQAVRHAEQVAAGLESLLGGQVPVYCFGNGLFAMTLNGVSVEQSLKMGKTLLRRLRQENFGEARLGLNTLEVSRPAPEDRQNGEREGRELVEEALAALQEAAKRGPSALYNWASRKDSSLAALALPSERTVRELARRWRKEKSFAIACLQSEPERGMSLSGRRFLSLLGHPVVTEGEGEVFVFLAGLDHGQALSWLQGLRQKLAAIKKKGGPLAKDLSAGVALYPCLDYSRPQTLANARKALLHARFLGTGSEAVFDDVTLNISGDVFYNEGDLAAAIAEYKKGLRLNPSSINLLNSLGVCEAQLNRRDRARRLFEQVLELDPRDFMALYNLGFASLQSGQTEQALQYFQRAHEQDRENIELILQLAKLYCAARRYAEAVELLQPLVAENGEKKLGESSTRAAVYRYLGEARDGLGQREEAVVALQRAVRNGPDDPQSLSLLGYLYCKADEGDDLSLSLCRRAVEIDGGKGRYWYHLAAVLEKAGSYADAEVALRNCLNLQRQDPAALQLLARVYEGMGKTKKAEKVRARKGKTG